MRHGVTLGGELQLKELIAEGRCESGTRCVADADLVLRRREHAGDRCAARSGRGRGAVVPTVWRLEVANALQMAIRRKRIDAAYRDAALAALVMLPITLDADTDTYAWTTTLRLAERSRLRSTMPPIWSWPSAAACRWRRSTCPCGWQPALLGVSLLGTTG